MWRRSDGKGCGICFASTGELKIVVMSRDSRDHYRPVLHLRHFADESGLLWGYDRSGTTAPFRQIAPNVGFEKGLYTIVEPLDGDPGALEAWLAEHIDGPAAHALDKLADDRPITNADHP